MTRQQAEEYFETLSIEKAYRFNALVAIALKLGKPSEGAYDYAKGIMENE